MSTIHILWDESHLWGLLLWRAAEALGLPYRLIKGKEIAHGLLSCKPPAVLVVPGGTARHKAHALGTQGMEAIRTYIKQGGHYIGFCGGAGLGLSGDHGLGLCPWSRATITNRMQHFISGHIHTSVKANHPLIPSSIAGHNAINDNANILPIWWPGRFAPQHNDSIEILASYTIPADDFWIADLPFTTLPPGTLDEWERLYDIQLRPSFLEKQPCVVHGQYGKGTYTLSYSHLETPDSPAANNWLVHLIEQLAPSIKATERHVPAWHLEHLPIQWENTNLLYACRCMGELIQIGISHSLLFQRNAWLVGWRTGLPGANLNNLHAALRTIASIAPSTAAQRFWNMHEETFTHHMKQFHKGVIGYLLAERLAMTLSKSLPDAVSRHGLQEQRSALFGAPMQSDGLYAKLLRVLDTLAFLQMARQ